MHEEVLKKHGFEHTEGGVYKHKDYPATVHLRDGNGPKTKFWSIQHGHNPAGDFNGVTGVHSHRQLDIALKNYKKHMSSQHTEASTYLEHLKAGGKPKEGGIPY